jgi:hypothetical protein
MIPPRTLTKPSKVERGLLKVRRPALQTGLTAAPESLAFELPVLPTALPGLATAQLPPDVMLFVSGQKALPTLLANVKEILTGVPQAPTNSTAVVQ